MKRSGFKKVPYSEALSRLKAKPRPKFSPKPKPRASLTRGSKPLRSKPDRTGGLRARVPKKGKTMDGDSARAIKDECDQLVREIIALRDVRCVTCYTLRELHVGHLFRRGLESVRWNLLNCNGQCDPCNSAHEENPQPYRIAFSLRYGSDAYFELERASQSSHKSTYVELGKIRDGLRAELNSLAAQKARKAA